MLRLNTDNGIVWTDATANAWKGCVKVSEGCMNCWAERIMVNFDHTDEFTIENANLGNITIYVSALEDVIGPLERLAPQWVFVPSSSDPYLPWVPAETRRAWWEGVQMADHLCFQVLTKWGAEVANPNRDEEFRARVPRLGDIPDHVMLGVSCESPRRRYRLDWLREQDAATKFVSFEPLVEKIEDVDLSGIDWIIVGGESHPGPDERREMGVDWPLPLLEAARRDGAAFLFKQHSGAHAESDRILNAWDGPPREFNEFPDVPAGLPPAPREFLEEAAHA